MVDRSVALGRGSSPGAACKVETCCHHSQSAMFPRRSRQGYWPTDDLRGRPGRCRHSEQGRLETCTQPPSPPDLHHATLCHTYSTENRIRKDQCHSERWLYSTASDRKSTRLNSSHRCISYAVFCLKKKIQISTRAYSSLLRIFLEIPVRTPYLSPLVFDSLCSLHSSITNVLFYRVMVAVTALAIRY